MAPDNPSPENPPNRHPTGRQAAGVETRTGPAEVWVVDQEGGDPQPVPDRLALEEPLEIRLHGGEPTATPDSGRRGRSLAVTMRTPGADRELALGFLFAEGVIRGRQDVEEALHLPDHSGTVRENVLHVRLRSGLEVDPAKLERHFFTTSACGLCGKANLEGVLLEREIRLPDPADGPRLSAEVLRELPARLRRGQGGFRTTGGFHAAALFDPWGEILAVREDVGRHNALDKVIGRALAEDWLPLSRYGVLVSGRASYELVQKSLAAGLPWLCAVSAPSSLAVATAREHGMTLVAFLREGRFNVYSGLDRLQL